MMYIIYILNYLKIQNDFRNASSSFYRISDSYISFANKIILISAMGDEKVVDRKKKKRKKQLRKINLIISGGKFESDFNDSAYKVDMVLHIRSVGPADFGSYKCVAKNSLGETDGTIKLYSKFYSIIHSRTFDIPIHLNPMIAINFLLLQNVYMHRVEYLLSTYISRVRLLNIFHSEFSVYFFP